MLSRVQLFATPWTIAHQALLSMNFPRQEYWSGLPCSPPGDLPDPEIEPTSFASPVLAGIFFTTMPPGKPQYNCDQALNQSLYVTSLVAQTVKCLPTVRETRVQSMGWEDLLEKAMATHSSIPAWKIPWTEEPGRLQSTGSQRLGHD